MLCCPQIFYLGQYFFEITCFVLSSLNFASPQVPQSLSSAPVFSLLPVVLAWLIPFTILQVDQDLWALFYSSVTLALALAVQWKRFVLAPLLKMLLLLAVCDDVTHLGLFFWAAGVWLGFGCAFKIRWCRTCCGTLSCLLSVAVVRVCSSLDYGSIGASLLPFYYHGIHVSIHAVFMNNAWAFWSSLTWFCC